jgi:UDP-N-acetylglucosamine--N-acetylmuramyl-(pentapeptide) pyrophosphoryl-undecaprenol N-acetylglucosamine transferase
LLIVGGSLGAKKLNEIAIAAINGFDEEICKNKLEVWHQCGSEHTDAVLGAYRDLDQKNVHVFPFIKDMARAYAWADLVLCRAGALTVSELAIMGRPALLVPLPNAIDNHQRINGNFLAECGAAKVLNQDELSNLELRNLLLCLMDSPTVLKKMAESASSVAKPFATHDICALCMEYIDRG